MPRTVFLCKGFPLFHQLVILLANRLERKCEILKRKEQGREQGGNVCHCIHKPSHQSQKRQHVWLVLAYPKEIPGSICEMNSGHFFEMRTFSTCFLRKGNQQSPPGGSPW